ncbi:alkylhydroperoxidase AhpD family core domain protein [Hartmannibacter diazotrophicus]|uniref:Alkylhydroperoxidase AhpD family core domain protein n=1 Tax=Hartmannibacter diazotrophicus TaxID=1482074 RepID=A0A2C9DDN1_9HYPH|nr:carboxymuconolactone decarboxylase family protein [Hartmannibacter diazotrophicus]SON58376.1 alkylhydroperoxidase AhpD family core domain protein [Hartmannibacter diazotrophicus]
MKARLNHFATAPELMQAVVTLSNAVNESGLEASLLHLVKLRASQINGCSFCVEMHSREARQDGEREERLYLTSAWRESPLFSERERAALAWTEALTEIAGRGVSDEAYDTVRGQFSDSEVTKLSVAIAMINTWNRLMVSARTVHPVAKVVA